MSRYNEIDYARDLIRWMEAGQKIRDRGVAAGFELPHSLAKLPETATPPLAPCEPSAEECEAEFMRGANDVCPEGGVTMNRLRDWERAGIAAVRALCLRAREAPSAEFVKAADALRDTTGKPWEYDHGHSNLPPNECPVCQCFREFDRFRALFVKEKLT